MTIQSKESKSAGGVAVQGRGGSLLRAVMGRVGLVVGSLVVMFLAVEGALRLFGVEPITATALSSYFQYDAETGWRGRPEVAMQFSTLAFSGYTSHGSDGFRRISRSVQGSPTVVWCVGDSGTWGWGVSDGQTYVDRLNERCGDGIVFRNLGICGYSTVQQYLLLREMLEGQEHPGPDVVLLLFCSNDLPENLDSEDQDPPRPYYLVQGDHVEMVNYPTPRRRVLKSLKTWFRQNSLAFNYLHFYITVAKRGMKDRMAGASVLEVSAGPEDQWRALEHGYTMIRDLCQRHGVTFVPVFLPPAVLRQGHDAQPLVDAYDDALRERFGLMAEAVGVSVIDISKQVRAHFASDPAQAERLAFVGDPHFNARGHELIGQAIWEEIQSFLPGPEASREGIAAR